MEHVLKLVHKKLESHARARLKSLEPRVSRLRRLLKPSGRLAALTRSLSMKTVTHAELELVTIAAAQARREHPHPCPTRTADPHLRPYRRVASWRRSGGAWRRKGSCST